MSILVPVLNEADHIAATVHAMRAQRFDGRLEFLFADGGSSDGTRELLEEMAQSDPSIRVLSNPRRRTPSGLNVCLREARGEYVARMDAHTFYGPTYVAAGVARLQAGDTQWVSGPAIPRARGAVSYAVGVALSTWLGRGGSRKWAVSANGAGPAEVELDTGVFGGVWRRQKLLEIGGWDEGWPSNQDAEMAARFLAAGERLVCLTEMAGDYLPRDTLWGLARQYHGYGYYRARTARRHPLGMRRSNLLAPGLVLAAAGAVVPGPAGRPGRAAMTAYLVAVLATSARAVGQGPRGWRVALPGVFVAMHGGNGVGWLQGVARFGVPWAALARLVGLDGQVVRLVARQGPDPVQAPSLDGA